MPWIDFMYLESKPPVRKTCFFLTGMADAWAFVSLVRFILQHESWNLMVRIKGVVELQRKCGVPVVPVNSCLLSLKRCSECWIQHVCKWGAQLICYTSSRSRESCSHPQLSFRWEEPSMRPHIKITLSISLFLSLTHTHTGRMALQAKWQIFLGRGVFWESE